VYSVVESIIEQSGTPYFCFKDLDENKPIASIKLRVETIDYFLKASRDTVQLGSSSSEASSLAIFDCQ
jgi:predicted nucleotide-binding protein (sugar kinase/HSP70/actin superfamily)